MSYATDEARDVFRLFYNKLVDLQMGLGRFYTLIAKSWEKAIRLALDFAICDESNMIDEQTAINACEVVAIVTVFCLGIMKTTILISLKILSGRWKKFLADKNKTD